MTTVIRVGEKFPDIVLPNHSSKATRLSRLTSPGLLDEKLGFLDGYERGLSLRPVGVGCRLGYRRAGSYGTNLLETIPWPEDKQRLEDYAELAGAPEKMIASFDELYKSDDARDPQEVADAISEFIMTPTGQRPPRTVVGVDFGVTGLNEAAAPFQRGVLEALAMQQMEQPVSSAKTA